MKGETYNKLIFLTLGMLICSLVLLIVVSDWFNQIPYSAKFKVNGYTKENAINVCDGKDLKKTSHCLNSFVKGIYNHVPTSDKEALNFEKIIQNGHDCGGWTFVYKTLFSELGFKTQKVSIDVSRESNIQYKHAFLIAYDKTGWCSLDQKDINCLMYKK